MTASSIYDQGLPHAEIKYSEHFQRGLDFFRIELFRSARQEFNEAMAFTSNDKACQEKIKECNQHIKSDAKKIYIIAPIVVAVIAIVILLFA